MSMNLYYPNTQTTYIPSKLPMSLIIRGIMGMKSLYKNKLEVFLLVNLPMVKYYLKFEK